MLNTSLYEDFRIIKILLFLIIIFFIIIFTYLLYQFDEITSSNQQQTSNLKCKKNYS